MPTYEYRCEKGHEFEVFQRMSEPPVESCIKCGATAERLLSAGGGLIFKGSGFYITDYARSDSYKKAAEGDKAPAADAPVKATDSAKPAANASTTDSGTGKSSGKTTPSGSSGTE
jgi:putative FmdB family regulatory protein